MRFPGRVLFTLPSLLLAPVLHAQTASQLASASALLNTPAAGLPPVYLAWNPANPIPKTGMMARYGRHRDVAGFGSMGISSMGVTADLGDRWSDKTQVTVGLKTCSGCNATLMGGVQFLAEFARSPLGHGDESAVLAIGAQPALGVAHTVDQNTWYYSATLGIPVAVEAMLGPSIHVEPFIVPGGGWGMTSEDGGSARNGFLATFGGGVGVYGDQVGVHFGMQRIFAHRRITQWGLGLSYRGPWR
ncbi:MAG TPA: hypothetical protein VLE53_04580 [Gemmatimonadaceae bacterium]|nr:hypothetical protein [Gemmatimonadaceae bacterium]